MALSTAPAPIGLHCIWLWLPFAQKPQLINWLCNNPLAPQQTGSLCSFYIHLSHFYVLCIYLSFGCGRSIREISRVVLVLFVFRIYPLCKVFVKHVIARSLFLFSHLNAKKALIYGLRIFVCKVWPALISR